MLLEIRQGLFGAVSFLSNSRVLACMPTRDGPESFLPTIRASTGLELEVKYFEMKSI
jgi:hypothetical protein